MLVTLGLSGCAGMLTNRQTPRVLEGSEQILGGAVSGLQGLKAPAKRSIVGPIDLYWRHPAWDGADFGLTLSSVVDSVEGDVKFRLSRAPVMTALDLGGTAELGGHGGLFACCLAGSDAIYVGVREGLYANFRRVRDDTFLSGGGVYPPPGYIGYYEHNLISQVLVGGSFGRDWRTIPELSVIYVNPGKMVLLLTVSHEFHDH